MFLNYAIMKIILLKYTVLHIPSLYCRRVIILTWSGIQNELICNEDMTQLDEKYASEYVNFKY